MSQPQGLGYKFEGLGFRAWVVDVGGVDFSRVDLFGVDLSGV